METEEKDQLFEFHIKLFANHEGEVEFFCKDAPPSASDVSEAQKWLKRAYLVQRTDWAEERAVPLKLEEVVENV